MQATVASRRELPDLPSASGIEKIGERIFVVGDDSAWLYSFDDKLGDRREYKLYKGKSSEEDRIPKKQKPDFEALAHFVTGGRAELLIFGSGSREGRRDTLLRVGLSKDLLEVNDLDRVSLAPLYDVLRANLRIVGQGKLNLEAAVVDDSKLILFQRGSAVSPNCALIFNLQEFLTWTKDTEKTPPEYILRQLKLPMLAGVQTGFSGAVVVPDTHSILFSASSEARIDAEQDGKNFGSVVGSIDLEELYGSSKIIVPEVTTLDLAEIAFEGKVESLALIEAERSGAISALAVTDDDQGGSELLKVRVTGITKN